MGLLAGRAGARLHRELLDAGLPDFVEDLDGRAEARLLVARDEDLGVLGLRLVVGDAGGQLLQVDEFDTRLTALYGGLGADLLSGYGLMYGGLGNDTLSTDDSALCSGGVGDDIVGAGFTPEEGPPVDGAGLVAVGRLTARGD